MADFPSVPTAVLTGFACAGKSFLAARAQDRWPEIEVLDSDEWLARNHLDEQGKAHIYNLFIDLGRPAALQEVKRQEQAFLAQQERSADPVLIAAGPALVSRPGWQQFVDRVEPSFIYLTQSAEQAANRLRDRRAHQIDKGLAQHPHGGSWDEDVLTARVGDEWVDVPPEQVLPNVEKHIAPLVKIYERLTPGGADRFSTDEARTDAGRERILERIGDLLGLNGSDT